MVHPDGTGGTSRLPNSDTRTHPRTQRIECFGVSRNRRFVAAQSLSDRSQAAVDGWVLSRVCRSE